MDIVNNAKKTCVKVKNHVAANKIPYAAAVITTTVIALQQRNRKEFDKFLTSKGIDLEEYYCPEAYEERMNSN
jgi:hypothetical protein